MVRFFGHFEGDAQTYKAKGENEYNRANRDCLKIFRAKVTGAGVVSDAELDAIDELSSTSSRTRCEREIRAAARAEGSDVQRLRFLLTQRI